MKTLDAPKWKVVVRKGQGVIEVISLPPRHSDDDDGLGVPVPARPKPRKGGAAAAPPQRERELVEA